MNNNYDFFEEIFFEKIRYIKRFNDFLITEYELEEIPYAVVGKPFPRIGEIEIDKELVAYRFHGRGVTLLWKEAEIFCNFDTSTDKHQIMISSWGWYRFLITFLDKRYNDADRLSDEADLMLKKFMQKGVLLAKYPEKITGLHVNEHWYKSYNEGLKDFEYNRDEIDWLY